MVHTVKIFLIMLNNLIQMHLKVLQKEKADARSDLIGYKIADKITKFSRTSPQNNSETVTNETENIGLEKEMSRKIYLST